MVLIQIKIEMVAYQLQNHSTEKKYNKFVTVELIQKDNKRYSKITCYHLKAFSC